MKNGEIFGKPAVFRPFLIIVVIQLFSYKNEIVYIQYLFSFKYDELVPGVTMVRLSIVLNGLNTAEITAFKQCLMTFQEKLESTISLAIIPTLGYIGPQWVTEDPCGLQLILCACRSVCLSVSLHGYSCQFLAIKTCGP